MTDYKYKENEVPILCPKCGSDDLGNKDSDWYTADHETKRYYCMVCEFRWVEHWAFESWQPEDTY